MSKALLNNALSSVNDPDSRVVGVFNSLSWRRGGLVYLTNAQSKDFNSVIDDKGDIVPSQRLSTGELVFMANDVPALGSGKYELRKKKNRAGRSMISGNAMDNGIIKVIIDTKTGDISSITDGNHEYVDADANSSMNSYRYLRGDDNPEKASGTDNVKITIKENGPLVASLLIESAAEGTSHLSREVSLIAGSNHIEIINIIDKLAIKEKEGVHFGYGFNISNPVTRADIPWGIMEIEKDQLPEGNRNWIGFQRWIDISNDERGVTFCSLDVPVFESGNMTANVLGMATDSPQWIRRLDPSATIYSWALNNHWFTNFPLSQEGIIQFRYRILPHDSKYDPAFSNRFGLEQAQPLITTTVNSTFEAKPPLSVKGSNNVYITVLKTGDTGEDITFRLRSVSVKDESVTLEWPGREPSEVKIDDYTGNNSRNILKDEVIVPAMGFVTLKAIW
jgi:alpha-mannosidase